MADAIPLKMKIEGYNIINQIKDIFEITIPPIYFNNIIIGRDAEVEEILTMLSQNRMLIIVNGIGGIGKTTLCKYLYMNLQKMEKIKYEHIAWVNYKKNIVKSFVDAFKHLKIPMDEAGSDEEKFDKIIFELNRLGDKLLIFIDNVDSNHKNDKQLTKLLQLRSHIIISSRMKVYDNDFLYPLGFLSDEGARELFCWHYKYVYNKKKDEVSLYLCELIRLCGNHALTIELLAKSMNANEFSIEKTVKMLKHEKFDLSAFKERVVCNWDDRRNERDLDKHIRKVFSIFKLSETQKNVINRLALLDASNLNIEYVKSLLTITDNEINTMINRGWIISNGNEILMHRVVKYAVIRQRKNRISSYYDVLQKMETLMKWEKVYSELDCLILHAEEVFREFYRCKTDKEYILADNIANYHLYQGDIKAAIFYLKKEILWLKRYPDNDVKIAECKKKMAADYLEIGDMDKAMELLREALHMRKQHFPPISLEIAECYAHIGYMYQEKGEYRKAICNYKKALYIRLKKDGRAGETTAWTYNNLAMVYGLSFEFTKGIYYIDKAIMIRENIAKQILEKPDRACLGVAQSEGIKGYILLEQGKYEEAYEILQHSYEIRKKYLKDQHIILATAKQRLAVALCMLNNLEDAGRLISEVFDIFQKNTGDNTMDLVIACDTYALIERYKGNGKVAVSTHLKAIRMFTKRFSNQHPKLLSLYENLGDTYKYINRAKEAEIYYNKALKIGSLFLDDSNEKMNEIRNKC